MMPVDQLMEATLFASNQVNLEKKGPSFFFFFVPVEADFCRSTLRFTKRDEVPFPVSPPFNNLFGGTFDRMVIRR